MIYWVDLKTNLLRVMGISFDFIILSLVEWVPILMVDSHWLGFSSMKFQWARILGTCHPWLWTCISIGLISCWIGIHSLTWQWWGFCMLRLLEFDYHIIHFLSWRSYSPFSSIFHLHFSNQKTWHCTCS